MLRQVADRDEINFAESFQDRFQIFRDANGGYFAALAGGLVEPIGCPCIIEGSATPTLPANVNVLATEGVVSVALPADGVRFRLLMNTTNTGAVTLDIDDTGIQAVTHPDGSALIAGDLNINDIILVVQDTVAGEYVFAGIDIGGDKFRSTQIVTSAQILAINTTAVNIIPPIASTGNGTVTIVNSIVALNNFLVTGYTWAGILAVQYITSGNTTSIDLTNVWAVAVADTIESSLPVTSNVIAVAGEGVEIEGTVADPTLGDGTWTLITTYEIVQF